MACVWENDTEKGREEKDSGVDAARVRKFDTGPENLLCHGRSRLLDRCFGLALAEWTIHGIGLIG